MNAYAILHTREGITYESVFYCKSELRAKLLAFILGGKYDGQILDVTEPVCERCYRTLICEDCYGTGTRYAH